MGDNVWLKRVLIPFWVLQMAIALFVLGLAVSVLVVAKIAVDHSDNDDFRVSRPAVEILNVDAGLLIALPAVTIIADIVEIVLVARNKLNPVVNIIIQSVKSALWTVYFVLSIIGATRSKFASGIILGLVIFLTCIGQLIYGAVIVHRHRKGTLYRGNYSIAETGQVTGREGPTFGGSYIPYNPQTNTEYTGGRSQPNPSPVPGAQPPTALHPAFKSSGGAHEYYGGNDAEQGYEMYSNGSRY